MAAGLKLAAVLLTMLLVGAACSTDDDRRDADLGVDRVAEPTTTTTATTPPTTTTTITTTTPTTTTTTQTAETTTTTTTTTTTLPGEPSDFGPPADEVLAVVGVAYDESLNLRRAPSGDIVAVLDPHMGAASGSWLDIRDPASGEITAEESLEEGVIATGNTRSLAAALWFEVRVGDLVGWVRGAHLAPLGSYRDVTSVVVDSMGEIPTTETMSALGLAVAAVFASSGEVQPQVTFAAASEVFEAIGETTVDVLGLPDDSVRGYRIHIAASAAQEHGYGSRPFTLRHVGITPICHPHRGVSPSGLCN